MKNFVFIFAFILFFYFSNSVALARIDSNKALFHIGEDTVVCGKVANVAKLKKRTMINLGNSYPREDLGILIWDNNLPLIEESIGLVDNLKNKNVCISGTIEIFREHLQIKLSNPKMIRLDE